MKSVSGPYTYHSTKLLSVFVAAFGVLTAGCAQQSVVEGVVHSGDFRLVDSQPLYRASEEFQQLKLIMSEEDGENLRVVTLTVPTQEPLETDVAYDISGEGEGLVEVLIAYGELQVTDLGDGRRLLTTIDTKTSRAAKGTLTFTSLDGVYAGDFDVELTDGGHATGSFVIDEKNQG